MSKKRFVFKKVITSGMFECSYKGYRIRIDTNGKQFGWIILHGKRPIGCTNTEKTTKPLSEMTDEYISAVVKQMVISYARDAHFYTEQVKSMVNASETLTKGL